MEVGRATIRFYAELAELGWDADRSGHVQLPVAHPRSVKDAIEACGIPHTEVGLILVNGHSTGFGHLVHAGDRISVYPVFTTLDVPSHVLPDPLPEPRFALDAHLGRLAERLRLLGFDSTYDNDVDDDTLIGHAVAEQRWILTRDRGVLMRAMVTHGYLVRSSDPDEQTIEVVRRYALHGDLRPFTRCAHCNGPLEPVDKAEVAERIPPRSRAAFEHFARCTQCGQLYWEGSHHDSLRRFVDRIVTGADNT